MVAGVEDDKPELDCAAVCWCAGRAVSDSGYIVFCFCNFSVLLILNIASHGQQVSKILFMNN